MIETRQFTLDNGLRVIHNYDDSTAMVAVNLLYDVGARDERPDLTGIAHLFEHLMFGGSVNVPEFDTVLEGAGGVSNAWTSNDFTNFYEVLPAVNLDTALYLESDRMLSLAFSDRALEVQRNVVTEEFKQQCLNRPYGDLYHHLRRMVYHTHPYGWPVIGKTPEHVAKVTQDDVRDFFFSHYSPHRAVLSISGNVTFDRVFESVNRWFGDIPRREVAPRLYAPEPLQTEPRLARASGNVSMTALTVAYRMGAYGDEDYIAADLLSDILANGNSSRMYRDLMVNTDLFAQVDASILGSEEPGMFLINAFLNPGAGEREVSRALDAIDKTLTAIADNRPPTDHEVERVLNRYESSHTYSHVSYIAKSPAMALAVMHGEDVNDMMPRYRATEADDISRVAKKIFDPSRRSTLIYTPNG